MEIKLNVLNNALELQDKKLTVIDEESIEDINKKVIEFKEKVTAEAEEEAEVSFPEISNVTEYREKTLPTHLLNIDVVKSALVSEALAYEKKA